MTGYAIVIDSEYCAVLPTMGDVDACVFEENLEDFSVEEVVNLPSDFEFWVDFSFNH